MSDTHCLDNGGDRRIGEHWEKEFCRMAADFRKWFTANQIGRTATAKASTKDDDGWVHLTLPDIVIWSAPGEHHEIKHKNPDHHGCYGLERYRLDHLIRFARTTNQGVYYTIHDWDAAGACNGRERVDNDIAHWFYADVATLARKHTRVAPGYSYYNGQRRWIDMDMGGIVYWNVQRFFHPLLDLWMPTRSLIAPSYDTEEPF